MTERIFLSARLQFLALWSATIATPLLIVFLTNRLVDPGNLIHLPLWGAILLGLVFSVVIHFVLRKSLKNVYLFGSAIYMMYKRERKLERQRLKNPEIIEQSQSV